MLETRRTSAEFDPLVGFHRRLILKYFGIFNCRTNCAPRRHDPMTLDQIGNELGVLRQRVSKKLREVLTQLQNNTQLEKIKQEWEDL